MADFIGKKCDGPNCDRVQQTANHWFTVWITKAVPNSVSNEKEFHCVHGVFVKGEGLKRCCGQICAHKLYDEFLSTGDLK